MDLVFYGIWRLQMTHSQKDKISIQDTSNGLDRARFDAAQNEIKFVILEIPWIYI